MKQFVALVHQEGDSAFGVEFPDLPGCFSAADDFEGIVPNAVEALQLWAEDEALPEASPLDEVRKAVADQLAKGAFLIMVPVIEDSSKVKRVNISIEQGLLDAIDSVAGQRKMTRSAFLGDAARKAIEQRL